jgi:cytochrome c oxidase subunit 4
MASQTKEAHGHDAHIEGAVHAHVSSTFFYVAVFAALLVLTVTTVGQSYIDLGRLNIVLVILIASMKAALVVSFFMHLRWDNKFNALIFISCIFFIGVFFAYTMNDTERRGELDADQNVKVWQKTGEVAPGGPPKEEHAGEHAPSPGGSGAPAPGGAEHGH